MINEQNDRLGIRPDDVTLMRLMYTLYLLTRMLGDSYSR